MINIFMSTERKKANNGILMKRNDLKCVSMSKLALLICTYFCTFCAAFVLIVFLILFCICALYVYGCLK